jgi:protoporphyrinogen oxidase
VIRDASSGIARALTLQASGIEAWLRARMPGQRIDTITKQSTIRYAGRDIDFPFQKNIHQLPQAEFIECLYDLFFRPTGDATSFLDMLYRKLGRGITEKFLRPYNEKLYATDLARSTRTRWGASSRTRTWPTSSAT